jgi:hypothetical protein
MVAHPSRRFGAVQRCRPSVVDGSERAMAWRRKDQLIAPKGPKQISPGQRQRESYERCLCPGQTFHVIGSPARAQQRATLLCRPFRASGRRITLTPGGATRLAPPRFALPWAGRWVPLRAGRDCAAVAGRFGRVGCGRRGRPKCAAQGRNGWHGLRGRALLCGPQRSATVPRCPSPCKSCPRDDRRSRDAAVPKSDDRSRDFATMNGSHPHERIHTHDPRDAVSGRAVSWLDRHFLEVRPRRISGIKAIHFQRFR